MLTAIFILGYMLAGHIVFHNLIQRHDEPPDRLGAFFAVVFWPLAILCDIFVVDEDKS